MHATSFFLFIDSLTASYRKISFLGIIIHIGQRNVHILCINIFQILQIKISMVLTFQAHNISIHKVFGVWLCRGGIYCSSSQFLERFSCGIPVFFGGKNLGIWIFFHFFLLSPCQNETYFWRNILWSADTYLRLYTHKIY